MKLLFIFSVLFVGFLNARKLPSYLELCPKSVKEAGPCIMKNVEIIRPKMEKGIPELLIPPLNPLELSKANLETGGINALFTNVKMYYLQDFILKDVKFDLENLDIRINIKFPKIDSSGDYTVHGKILMFDLNSKGRSEGNFTNLGADVDVKMELVDKQGKKYLKIVKADIKLDIQDISMHFSNLFPNNKELTENANKVLNENSKEVMKEFLPVVNEIIKSIVVGITQRIFEKFSFDELFP